MEEGISNVPMANTLDTPGFKIQNLEGLIQGSVFSWKQQNNQLVYHLQGNIEETATPGTNDQTSADASVQSSARDRRLEAAQGAEQGEEKTAAQDYKQVEEIHEDN